MSSPNGQLQVSPGGVGPQDRNEPVQFWAQGRSIYAFGALVTMLNNDCQPTLGQMRFEFNNGVSQEYLITAPLEYISFIFDSPCTLVSVRSISGGTNVQLSNVTIGVRQGVHDADTCSFAREIFTGTSTWDNFVATTDALPLNLSPYPNGGNDVWMTWTSVFTGSAIIQTSSMPAFLVVYDGAAGCPTADTPYVVQSCVEGQPARVEFHAELGRTYFIRAGGQFLPPNFFGERGSVPITVSRAPACVADVNGDGLLNIFDYLAFQTAFGNGC